MKRGSWQTWQSMVEFALFGAGFALLGAWAALTLSARTYQRDAAQLVDRWSQTRHKAGPATAGYQARVEAFASGILGRLEIPAAHISVIVAEGVDSRTLDRAVGHVPDTALPGEPGNVGLVAHRDTYFRGLEHIHQGDEVRFQGPDGLHRYRVSSMRVVEPTDVAVLDPTPRPALTLVTCYPFHVIGPARRRFVVRAEPLPVPAAPAAAGGGAPGATNRSGTATTTGPAASGPLAGLPGR